MKLLFCLFSLLLSVSVFAQDIKPEEKLVLSDTVVFLGIDFSLLKMINPAQKDKADELKNTNGQAWSSMGGEMCKYSNFKFDFSKKKVVCMAQLFDTSYRKWGNEWVVDSAKGLTEAQIAPHVRTYPAMTGYRLGLVFIIDQMDVKKGIVTMYGTYVDLTDHSVIKAIRSVGGEDGIGFTKSWAGAVTNAYTAFVNTNFNYLNRLKAHFKKEKNKEKKAKEGPGQPKS